MKATIIGSMKELDRVKTKGVVLCFRPSIEDFVALKMKRIKLIQINPASEKSLSKSAKDLLGIFKIELRSGSMQGVRKDRDGVVINIE